MSDSASAMRSPAPYISSSTARSRAPIQSSLADVADRVGEVDGLVGRDRARQALLDPRAAQAGRGGLGVPGLLAGEGEEGLERRQLARGRDVADAVGAARGELVAQGAGVEAGEVGPVLGADLRRAGARRSRHRRAPCAASGGGQRAR